MSIKRTRWTYVLFPAILLLGCAGLMAQDEPDPVIEYYWDKAASAYHERNLCDLDIPYRVEAVVYYFGVDGEGRTKSTDSTGVNYFCTGSTVDSQTIIFGDAEHLNQFDLQIRDIFDIEHMIFSYPNDTGGLWLPIGLDTKAGSLDPTGFVVIDRSTGDLRWTYLHYPRSPEYRRLSRCRRVADFHGYMFPDSVWEIGARDGFFSSENYRIEARITDVELLEKAE